MENCKEKYSLEDEDEQKMEFLSQFFDNKEIEDEVKAVKRLTKKKRKRRIKKQKHEKAFQTKHDKDIIDIPDEPILWCTSFAIFSLMGYLFDIKLIYLTPVIFVAFILYLISKTQLERKQIFSKLNLFEPLSAVKLLLNHKAPRIKPQQAIYMDELEHPLLTI